MEIYPLKIDLLQALIKGWLKRKNPVITHKNEISKKNAAIEERQWKPV